ncbi:PDZ domain-containing protein [Gemmata sp. JC717]|uniref:PDZ domain-containing protein n=1 Tax=Gemmata algarum TaxID=2975278 RepID=UPI0021BADD08|nr:PDZ domain-containing protein [Gemmata algarum]MDY3556187.1 PDZ domain-containing protein [Gemmata algarum]
MTRICFALLAFSLMTSAARPQPKPADDVAGYRTLAEATTAKVVAPKGGPGRVPYLGAAVAAAADGRAVVEDVQPGSPAAKAGLKTGDVVVRVGENAVKTPQAFREWLQSYRAGDVVTLGVSRDGKTTDLTAALAAVSRPMTRGGGAAPIGVTLVEDKSGKGIFVETVQKDSPAASSGLKAGDLVLSLDGAEMSRPSRLGELIAERRAGDVITFAVTRDGKPAEVKVTLAAERSRSGAGVTAVWTGPSLRLAVVCVEFADTQHNAKVTPRELDRAFFSQDGHTGKNVTGKDVHGSLGDYFREQSAGAFRLEGKVFDWVAVAKKRGDYIQGSGTSNKTALLADALALLTARDGERALDGFDAVAFVYAGSRYRTNRGAVYYPHSGTVSFKGKAHRYLIGEEGGTSLAPIGTFVKPLCELLGVPDLAARTENIGSEGLGPWCAMSDTFETARPQHLSAWCKERLGWLKPVVVDPTVKQKLVLSPRECLKVLVRPDGSEYLLLECRTKKGFDTDLPAEGLLIWRVVDGRPVLEEAHGVEGPSGPTSSLSAVPYPSPANTAFTPLTTPSSRSPQGGGLPVHITNIRRLTDGRVAFQIGYEFR